MTEMSVASLRKAVEVLERHDPGDAIDAWQKVERKMKAEILSKDPRKFLRFESILRTMYLGGEVPFTAHMLSYLLHHENWRSRWERAINEPRFGSPTPFAHYKSSSGTVIMAAYHLARFEDETRTKVSDYPVIIEFGAGYGGMCRMIHELGFKGQYIIYDLPVVSELQKFYLSQFGIEPLHVQTLDALDAVLEHISIDEALFLGLMSIAETPADFRARIMPRLLACKSYLIAYASMFYGINNDEWFRRFERRYSGHRWRRKRIDPVRPDKWHLFGVRKGG